MTWIRLGSCPFVMAGNFKLSIVIAIFCCLLIAAKEENGNSKKDLWFSNFEVINAEIERKQVFTERYPTELHFNTSDKSYHFDLVLEIPPLINQNLHVHVNDKYDIPISSLGEGIVFYKGKMMSRTCEYVAYLKITNEGLDAFIICDNNYFYLEPTSRYESTENDKTEQHIFEKSPKLQFQCIFYRSNDVKLGVNGTGISWEGRSNITKMADDIDITSSGRYKRETRSVSQTECTIHLVADYTFYTKTGHSDIHTTIAEMSYIVFQANLIFRGTDFDGDGSGDNIGFYISDISIFTEPNSCKMANAVSVESYLELFSEYDFSKYCLATAFTSQNFADGVVGLAWVGSSNEYGPSGGICQHRILYNYVRMCLNTNLITNINEGSRFPAYLSSLVLAHEFGHSFGSPHDNLNDAVCTPGGDYGNYLMYPYASEGGKPNNNIFSPCSINYIYPVIRNKGTCFKETVVSICGNNLREGDEECDCGTMLTCAAIDPCCTPSDVSELDPDHPCTFRRSQGSRCSPNVSHCCTQDCKIVSSVANKVCKVQSECTEQSICDGLSSVCPMEVKLPDKEPCAGGTRSCIDGVCIGSVCATINQIQCSCSDDNVCYTCCLNSLSECLPYTNENNEKLPLTAGTSCNTRQGFCNGRGDCISVDETSTMDRLKEVFTDEEADSVAEWLKNQWYYVVLAVVAILFLVLLFVKTCRKDRTIHTSAYMYGRLIGIQREAEIQKAYLQRRRREIKDRYMKKIDKTENFALEIDFPTAIARMMVFFPTTPVDVIVKTLKTSSSEESAVRWLLLRNDPFRRFCKSLDNK